ncbi:BolA-like protein 3, partial [Frankliniella fusca]
LSQTFARRCSSNSGEVKIKRILQKTFPKANVIEVVDISGGCGAMYDITVEAPELKGLNIVKQHRMVNEVISHTEMMVMCIPFMELNIFCLNRP